MEEDLRSQMASVAHAERYITSHIKSLAPYWVHLYLCKHSSLMKDDIYHFLYKESEKRIVEELVQMHAQIGQPTTRQAERKNLQISTRMQINSRKEAIDAYGEFVTYLHDLIQEYQNKA